MIGGMRIGSYRWAGGEEPLLRFGPDDAPRVVVALPLYEEANRTRAFAATLLRALAGRGIGGVLPDLPGTGESLIATADASLSAMRSAFASLAGPKDVAVSIRSGALLDTDVAVRARWHLAPVDGSDLVRELRRLQDADGLYAGNPIPESMIAALAAARPAPARVVRPASDSRPADLSVDAAPLWRRAEPGNDVALADRLAADIAEWIASCGG